MRRIIIVDDEVWVRKGIIKNIEWDELGLELVGEAQDGDEALEKIKECHPDILITDMRMPGTDGRELIRRVKEYSPNTATIIVSGYSDFEYTKEAIVSKAFDYILKPIKKTELNDVLRKTVCYLDRMDEQDSFGNGYKLKIGLLNRLLNDRVVNIENYPEKVRETLNDLFIASHIQVGICKLLGDEKGVCRSYDEIGCFDQLIAQISERLNNVKIQSEIFINELKVDQLVIIVYSFENIEKKDLKIACHSLLREFKSILDSDINFYFGSEVNSINEINVSYEHALRAGRLKKVSEKGVVLFYSEETKQQELFPVEKEKLILEFIRQGDERNTIRAVENFISYFSINNPTVYNLQKSAILLLGSIEKLLIESDTGFEELFNRSSISYTNQVMSCERLEEIYILLISIVKGTVEFIQESKRKNGSLIIEEVIKYINENYFKNISLNDIAYKYYMNPNYVSRLFKNKTGCNFIDFLTQIRIEKAKHFLVDTENKNYDISRIIGYEDYRYFSQVFKKYTGFTPTEYRLKYTPIEDKE